MTPLCSDGEMWIVYLKINYILTFFFSKLFDRNALWSIFANLDSDKLFKLVFCKDFWEIRLGQHQRQRGQLRLLCRRCSL
ncbi:hypothetical protein OJAV_G00235910 [Oryzias javanicus]|uniref:Uncharacterized protein n=1 Tax=Oryzias javanicus TaxID=123683 RepID=A0A3S2MB20_ORYJA|nr:hypothetical protein OJAV_G00235910 [Oryzias javanicus]